MNFTTEPMSDTARRIVNLSVSGAPDTISHGAGRASYAVTPSTVELSYTWDGWKFEMTSVVVKGVRVLNNGNPGKRTDIVLFWITQDESGSHWNAGTPAWVRMLGERYADPDNPTA